MQSIYNEVQTVVTATASKEQKDNGDNENEIHNFYQIM
jgi:hypothetical protein